MFCLFDCFAENSRRKNYEILTLSTFLIVSGRLKKDKKYIITIKWSLRVFTSKPKLNKVYFTAFHHSFCFLEDFARFRCRPSQRAENSMPVSAEQCHH